MWLSNEDDSIRRIFEAADWKSAWGFFFNLVFKCVTIKSILQKRENLSSKLLENSECATCEHRVGEANPMQTASRGLASTLA